MQPRGNHAPFVMRAFDRSAVHVWAQFQCARMHGAHNALVTKSFRRSLSPKLFCQREKSLRNERRLHAVDHSGS